MNRLNQVLRSGLGLLFVVALASIPIRVQAETDTWPAGTATTVSARGTSVTGRNLTFGTATEAVRVVHALEFDPFVHAASTAVLTFFADGILRYDTGSFLAAGVQLPSGALLTRYEVEACDTDAAGEVRFEMFRSTSPGGGAVTVGGLQSTGVPDTPGCAFFPVDIVPDVQVDNQANYFNIFVAAANANLRIAAVRVFYRLEVSPAPAVASFTDVPTSHPFFQYVEALRASGITVGCTATTYCPDAPLTRGQMAVFLSKGLGLHFAP